MRTQSEIGHKSQTVFLLVSEARKYGVVGRERAMSQFGEFHIISQLGFFKLLFQFLAPFWEIQCY